MSFSKFIISIVLFALILLGWASVFTIKQTELALKLRFGEIISTHYEPGLHFKLSIFEQVRRFDKRVQSVDSNPEHFLTKEKKNLIVDSFIKWRIANVTTYFTAVGGHPQRAGQRLSEVIADGLRSEFGKRTIQEVVSGERAKVMDTITEQASQRALQLGIEIVDVRIKRIELPKEVSSSVYRRMEAERERVAKELRSRGEAAAVRIQAEADRQRVEVLAKAERDADQIRGEGDGTATDIYAKTYSKSPEFYALYRTLHAYRETFKSPKDILLLQPNSEFFKYFKAFNLNQPKPTQIIK